MGTTGLPLQNEEKSGTRFRGNEQRHRKRIWRRAKEVELLNRF